MSLHHGLRATAGASPADPYFSSTSLLLLGNGTNGGQNNTFVDSSTNNFTVTRNGNTTQGSFGPFGYNWSNYFDGSGDYLSVASASAIDISTGDWTIEGWCYATAKTNLVDGVCGYGSYGAMMLYYSGTNWIVEIANGSSIAVTISSTATLNTWQHLAVTRSGNTFTLWINGTSAGTGTSSATLAGFSRVLYIGYNGNSTQYFTGNISNFRLLKGTALYTSAFTPPTAPLTAITNTSLLTCQSNRFLDNSSNAFAITPSGDARVTNFAPFPTKSEYSTGVNGGSGYFDGSGDYLTVADNAALDVGSSDFTYECWLYPTTSPSGVRALFAKRISGTFGGVIVYFNNSLAPIMQGTVNGSSWGLQITSSISCQLNAWNHIAFTRSSNTWTIWVNGASGGTQTLSGTVPDNSAAMSVAADEEGSTNVLNASYISQFRLVKGTAVYTTAFTPPTAPLTAITNTSLLLNFTNASILDSTGKNDLGTVGDAQISTAVKKFGTGSLKFDGTGDYLLIQNNSSFNFGSSDWTIEAWIYPTSISVDQQIYAKNEGSYPGGYEVVFLLTSGNKLQFASYGSSLFYAQSTGSISANVWTHVVAVRNGSTITLYINGTADGTATPQTIQSTTSRPTIGRDLESIGGGRYFTGYIDDLRITKGVARYTSNFTPPSAQLPAR